ncbi:hypothetical protein IU459_05495 [Nocardia amamiensis]|uniref:Uncharacterized protein n=1 Tax=Nocardia amamiensis TaxID=404578 RepID=A0ABS0CK54_9NOCA|nr:hypothetical protein [Nocardia amamiensis]MBF6296997.1 hypothetical protein [Nocardia amamiensis]
MYERLWGGLRVHAVYGDAARSLITSALEGRRGSHLIQKYEHLDCSLVVFPVVGGAQTRRK